MAHKVKVLAVLDGLQMIDFFIVLHIKELGKEVRAYTIFAMDVDGKNKTNLASVNPGVEGDIGSFSVYYMDMNDPDHIYIYWNNRRLRVADFYKLNIYTGKPTLNCLWPRYRRQRDHI